MRSPAPATNTAAWSSPRSTTPAGRAAAPTASCRCGRHRGSPRSTAARHRSGWRSPTSARSSPGSPRRPKSPSEPAATASRSTPGSTAWCASSCRVSPTTAPIRGAKTVLLFARQVIAAVRPHTPLLGLRLCCDELAPWAGITPEMAPTIAVALVDAGVDYVVVVRGSIYSAEQTRPDFHEPTGFNIDVCRAVKAALPNTPVFLQGSVVDWGSSRQGGRPTGCDGVEMTRAQIADPDLVAKLRSGTTTRSGRASAAIRRARCATSATRSSAVSANRRPAARPRTPTGTRRRRTPPRRGRRRRRGRAGSGPCRGSPGTSRPCWSRTVSTCRRDGSNGRSGGGARRMVGVGMPPPRRRDPHRYHVDARR